MPAMGKEAWEKHSESMRQIKIQERQKKKIHELKKNLSVAIEVLKMVQDNTKMPHQHNDPQLRLYCLSERATEALVKLENL